MARRLHQTLADYMVIAISPALIMGLVGSLMFFLLRVFYQGEFQERLHWVMTCFVFASVLIARIAIEDGFERAAPFGAALALLVGIAANRFVEYHGTWIDDYSWVINFSVIGIVWFCAHQLTWDCTVIDDSEDASGQGLMQVVGLERSPDEKSEAAERTEPVDEHRLEGTTSREVPTSYWQRYLQHQRRPHAPGVWVVYFSLAALPIFGVGQLLIPADNTDARRAAFRLMCAYVACGLGLLLTTSFLGLRRYLRQRRIEMPTLMANVWLGAGTIIVLVLLVAAAILPRPNPEYAISELPVTIGSPQRDASRHAPSDKDGTEDKSAGKAAAEQDTDRAAENPPPDGNGNQPGGESKDGKAEGDSESKQPSGEEQGEGKSQSSQSEASQQGKSSGKQAKQAKQDAKQQKSQDGKSPIAERFKEYRRQQKEIVEPYTDKAEQNKSDAKSPTESQQAEPPPVTPPELPQPPLGPLANLLKWAFYAAFVLGVLFALWRFRHDVLAAIRAFLAELANWWAALWGGKRDFGDAEDAAVEIRLPPSPFASFADPFATGMAARMPLEELVRYSFDAFEAWSNEHGCPRSPEQTPHELARDVARLNAPIAADARNLAELYAQAAYSRGQLHDNARAQLEQLWRQMTRRSMPPSELADWH